MYVRGKRLLLPQQMAPGRDLGRGPPVNMHVFSSFNQAMLKTLSSEVILSHGIELNQLFLHMHVESSHPKTSTLDLSPQG